MTASLEEWIAILGAQFWIGLVVLLRVAAVTALLPGFGEQSVSLRVKLVVALCFTLIVAPAIGPVPPQQGMGQLTLLVLSETIAGVVIGLGIRLFILALQTAGMIAAQSTSLSQILGGASVEPLPAMGYVLTMSAICLAVMSGLHVKAAELLILSYRIMPVGLFLPGADVADWGLDQVRRAFSLALTLSMPFVILSILYNLMLGAINKAMPQLMVAFVGAPLITLGGLFLLFVTAPLMLPIWLAALDGFMANPLQPVP